ncbi:hypothetical protein UPYG_G00351030 [Umbra pygmaea]|uniref:A-kinase anchor protein 2-like n=1 Tax=Umbra pygmaea TaxID=75934 RepID=A0ABD0W2Q8_UMBPY
MAESELHKERLQALTDKRKRQSEIEDKRRQLDDVVLQLQHLKSKAMRERWLLQDTPSGLNDEDDGRRRQLEKDEEQGKRLEDTIYRLENDIGLLESEESQISAKEQNLRERLKKTERSIEDLQKSLQNEHGSAEHASGDHPRTPVMYAMEINVERDRKTGPLPRSFSASPASPDEVSQRGIKVFDDGRKVVYEVRAGGATTLENGVHPWNSTQVEELMQRVGAPAGRTEGGKAKVTVTSDSDLAAEPCADLAGPYAPSSTPPAAPPPSNTAHQIAQPQAPGGAITTQPPPSREVTYEGQVQETPQATAEKPVTMIFMGYQSVDDQDETKRLLGFDGTIKAEIVLIDEDDEKSLREKTVTDISTMDGNAADLVSGARPVSDTTELSSDGKDDSSGTATKELPPPAGKTQTAPGSLATGNGIMSKPSITAMKPSKSLDDESGQLKRERPERKSVSFLDSVSVIPADKLDRSISSTMEVGSRSENCFPSQGVNGTGSKNMTGDMEGAQEIAYLDEVLEANCCDTGLDPMASNGTATPERAPREVDVTGTGPSVHISNTDTRSPPTNQEVRVEGRKQTTFTDQQEVKDTNGHSGPIRAEQVDDTTSYKKEARFELRAFQEEKKPSKLFEPCKKEVRVKKVRPSEEVAELERERLELIRGQAVKKNPDMGSKWWNPPQEKSLEDELEPDKLESHRKYEERKQQRRSDITGGLPQMYSMTFDPLYDPESNPDPGDLQSTRKDIVVEQIDFAAARKQFLQVEDARQQAGEMSQVAAPRRSVAPQLYSAKPFSRVPDDMIRVERSFGSVSVGYSSYQGSPLEDSDVTGSHVQTERIHCSPTEPLSGTDNLGPSLEDGEFTCARAVMTFLKDEGDVEQHCSSSLLASRSSCQPEECDSGLDELSLRSQDTTVLETLSNDFSMDNISDSGASNETTSAYMGDSFPCTPQATTPVNGQTASKGEEQSLGRGVSEEEQLEYQAGILVQTAIQHALRDRCGGGEDNIPQSSPLPPTERHLDLDVLPPSSGKLSSPPSEQLSPTALELHPPPLLDLHPPPSPQLRSPQSPLQQSPTINPSTPSPPPRHQLPPAQVQVEKSPQRSSCGGPKIIVQSALSRSLALNPDPVPVRTPVYIPPRPVEPPQLLPSPSEKDQFSYFSKYSEAAELRSTAAATRAQESEPSAGPFKLRSRKQQTLSMIEEEIRAAQKREEELKSQRQNLGAVRSGPGPRTNQTGRPTSMTISPRDKQKSNSLPARLSLSGSLLPTKLSLTSKTAPGKIEKARPVPPVSPSSSEGALPSPLSDMGSDDSGGSGRPKNFMQTMMEDYETHKVKRREKVEDNSYARLLLSSGVTTEVLEATRVTRRKSNMALRWEAGLYANEDGEEEEEEEEEE